jgi:hypothetical protein
VAEVICPIFSLRNKNYCGYNELSNKILKLCGQHVFEPLTYIYNLSLNSGIYQDQLKYANIKPCFKKSDKSLISNYKPIYLLTGFSKIFEMLIFSRLKQYLVSNDILVAEQHGFCDRMSIENAIFRLTELILQAWNNRELIRGLFCDLSEAFDCVNHELLIQRLGFYGVKGSILNWVESYFTEISHPVCEGGGQIC